MALLFMDGFDLRDRKLPYIRTPSGTDAGRFGGYGQRSVSGHRIVMPLNDTYRELFIGFASNTSDGSLDIAFLAASNDSGNTGELFRISSSASGQLIALRSGTSVATSAPGVILPGVWMWMEMHIKLIDVGGLIEIKANGLTVLSFTGNTLGSTPNGNRIDIIDFNDRDHTIDDLYICDPSGSSYNTYLGEIQIVTLKPNGNGTFSQLLGSDGNSVDNYLLVDEIPAVMTDKVSSAVVGQRDTYTFTDIEVAGQVLAVQVSASISKDVAGLASMKIIERLANGSERLSDAIPATNQALFSTPIRTTDPTHAVWTTASVNAAQFGVEVA